MQSIAFSPDGNKAIVGNPGTGYSGSPSKNVSLLDLNTWSTTAVNTDVQYPTGLKTFTSGKAVPPVKSIPEFGSVSIPLLG